MASPRASSFPDGRQIKHITSIEARHGTYDGFFMKSAYRVPNGKFPTVQRFLSRRPHTPITEMVVNSMITNLVETDSTPD